MDLNAENVVIPIFVLAKHRIPVAAPSVKQKNLQQPALFFIIVNFLSARHFILLIMFARARLIFLPMSLQDGYHFDR
jgi:hypothetical protein